jgi:methylated-DNA-[protein]-cysteine S-methyltransferase
MPRQEREMEMSELLKMSEEWQTQLNSTRLHRGLWRELEQRLSAEERAFRGDRIYYASAQTEVGQILVASTSEGLCRLALPTEDEGNFWNWLRRRFIHGRAKESEAKNSRILEELRAYFSGELTKFDVPLDVRATPFQEGVLREIARIPFGKTLTYGEIAKRIGNPVARQAVGAATGSNPIPIVIPCHRVVGADGRMVGYGGGIPLKEWLLHLEGHAVEDHRLVPKSLFS